MSSSAALIQQYLISGPATITSMLRLEEVLQRLYDSEINVTITMLWDGGFDFAFRDGEETFADSKRIILTKGSTPHDRGDP
jgi:hypothetical protein